MANTVTYTERAEDTFFSLAEVNQLFTDIKTVVDAKLDVRGDTLSSNARYLSGVFNLPANAPAGALRRQTDELVVADPQAITVVETDVTLSTSTTSRTVTISSEAVGDTVIGVVYHTSRLTSIPANSQILVDAANGDDFDMDQPYITVLGLPVLTTGNITFAATQSSTGKMALVTLLLRGGTIALDSVDRADSTQRTSVAATFAHPLASSVGGPGIVISAMGCSLTNSTTNLHSAGWTSVTSAGSYNPAELSVAYRMVTDREIVTGTCAHGASATRHSGVSLLVRLNCIAPVETFDHPALELETVTADNVTTAVSENFRRIYAALNHKVPLAGPFSLKGNWAFTRVAGLDPSLFIDYGPSSAGDPND